MRLEDLIVGDKYVYQQNTKTCIYAGRIGNTLYFDFEDESSCVFSLKEAKIFFNKIEEKIEYYECIKSNPYNSFTKGKIYKLIEGRDKTHHECFIDNDGDENSMCYFDDYFKPSTKEAFDKQNIVKECVHCKSQEEWDYVLSKSNPKELRNSTFGVYESNSCILTEYTEDKSNIGCYCGISFYEENNYTILSFSDWCKKYNHEGLVYNQGFLVGDYSNKPLILEISDNPDFRGSIIVKIYYITKSSFITDYDISWEYARKIDPSKYQIPLKEVNTY